MYPILRDYQVFYNRFDFGYSNFHASYRSIFVNSLAIVANEATSCTSSAPQRNKQIKEKKLLENQFNVAMDALDLWKKRQDIFSVTRRQADFSFRLWFARTRFKNTTIISDRLQTKLYRTRFAPARISHAISQRSNEISRGSKGSCPESIHELPVRLLVDERTCIRKLLVFEKSRISRRPDSSEFVYHTYRMDSRKSKKRTFHFPSLCARWRANFISRLHLFNYRNAFN